MNAETDLVERLHGRLTAAIRASRRQPGSPVSVSEIYQELVPYRDVRQDVGFAMNADYEHTLLRLLAGEGGHVRLEPHTARDAIRDELCLPNPNVGMYRDFAGCDVFVLTSSIMDDILDDDEDMSGVDVDNGRDWRMPDPDAARDENDARDVISHVATFSMVDDEPADDAEASDEQHQSRGEAGTRERSQQPGAGPAGAASSRCAYCDSALPGHRPVRFCPYCGADQTTRPCASCGESLEPGWTFCVACGSGQDEASA